MKLFERIFGTLKGEVEIAIDWYSVATAAAVIGAIVVVVVWLT